MYLIACVYLICIFIAYCINCQNHICVCNPHDKYIYELKMILDAIRIINAVASAADFKEQLQINESRYPERVH